MTRPEIQTLMMEMYQQLIAMAQRKINGDLGVDAVHQAYVLILENGTYKKLPRSRVEGRRFLVYKVRTALERLRTRERKQERLKGKGHNTEEVEDEVE